MGILAVVEVVVGAAQVASFTNASSITSKKNQAFSKIDKYRLKR